MKEPERGTELSGITVPLTRRTREAALLYLPPQNETCAS